MNIYWLPKIRGISINSISQFGVAFNYMTEGTCLFAFDKTMFWSANRKWLYPHYKCRTMKTNEWPPHHSRLRSPGFKHDAADVLLKQHISVRESDLMSSISQHDAAGHKLLSQRKHTDAPGSAEEMNIAECAKYCEGH